MCIIRNVHVRSGNDNGGFDPSSQNLKSFTAARVKYRGSI